MPRHDRWHDDGALEWSPRRRHRHNPSAPPLGPDAEHPFVVDSAPVRSRGASSAGGDSRRVAASLLDAPPRPYVSARQQLINAGLLCPDGAPLPDGENEDAA